MESDSNPDPNALVPQEIAVTLKDGTVLSWRCDIMLANQRAVHARQHSQISSLPEFAAAPLRPGTGETLIDLVDRPTNSPMFARSLRRFSTDA
jgi:hypothetical protein